MNRLNKIERPNPNEYSHPVDGRKDYCENQYCTATGNQEVECVDYESSINSLGWCVHRQWTDQCLKDRK
jgi:hypothetical protein